MGPGLAEDRGIVAGPVHHKPDARRKTDRPRLQFDAETGAQQLEHDPLGHALLFAVPRREGKGLGREHN